jgi:hypothetical protein
MTDTLSEAKVESNRFLGNVIANEVTKIEATIPNSNNPQLACLTTYLLYIANRVGDTSPRH